VQVAKVVRLRNSVSPIPGQSCNVLEDAIAVPQGNLFRKSGASLTALNYQIDWVLLLVDKIY
jgi:hypothetical protein